jgi:glycosyltransferase involved in cell wall biosynthesis
MRSFLAPVPERAVASVEPPTISVVIPVYEAAAFVGEAVDSALGQTVAPLEIIVCDDGSTDDLRSTLAPYGDRISIVHKEHGGLASAKNVGTQAASGEFVAFLDADNTYLPGYVEAVRELAAARPDLDVLATDAYLELNGQVYGRYYHGKARFVVDDQRTGIIHQHFIVGNAAFRRERLLTVGGFDETVVAEDTDCLIRLILDGSRAGLIDEPLLVYRVRAGSLSSRRPRALRAAADALERAHSHPSLSPSERSFLEHELAVKRRETALAEAEEALRQGASSARRRSLRIVFGPRGYGVAPRARALLAAAAPGTAGRYLAWKDRTSGVTRLATRTYGR